MERDADDITSNYEFTKKCMEEPHPVESVRPVWTQAMEIPHRLLEHANYLYGLDGRMVKDPSPDPHHPMTGEDREAGITLDIRIQHKSECFKCEIELKRGIVGALDKISKMVLKFREFDHSKWEHANVCQTVQFLEKELTVSFRELGEAAQRPWGVYYNQAFVVENAFQILKRNSQVKLEPIEDVPMDLE